MESALRSIPQRLPEILLARYPFLSALSLMMLLGERAENEKYPPINPRVIYVHVGIFLVAGFLLSAKFKRKEVALVYAGQLAYFAYNMYSNVNLGYTKWQRLRMATRHLGCVGIFILFSSLFETRPSKQLRKLGETVTGIFLMCYVYLMNNSPEDKRGFLTHIPGDDWSRYLFTLILAGGAISFFSGYFLRDVALSVIVALGILTVFVDCDIKYWVEGRGMHFWNQVRLILDDLCLILGFSMIVAKFDNKVKVD